LCVECLLVVKGAERCDLSSRPNEEAVMPLPRELATPP